MKRNSSIVSFSQQVARPRREYEQILKINNSSGAQTQLEVSPSCSFDGHCWTVHDDEIRLSICDIGEYDESGKWEDNPDIMSSADGVVWLTFTPHEARNSPGNYCGWPASAARLRRSIGPTPNCWKNSPRANGISVRYGQKAKKRRGGHLVG